MLDGYLNSNNQALKSCKSYVKRTDGNVLGYWRVSGPPTCNPTVQPVFHQLVDLSVLNKSEACTDKGYTYGLQQVFIGKELTEEYQVNTSKLPFNPMYPLEPLNLLDDNEDSVKT